VADKKVNVPALRDAAKKLAAPDGPIAYLENAAKKLQDAKLSSMAFTILGMATVRAHNEAAQKHHDNVQGGTELMRKASEQLTKVADNWAKSDQPWVVK
jgi:hypothetical protein